MEIIALDEGDRVSTHDIGDIGFDIRDELSGPGKGLVSTVVNCFGAIKCMHSFCICTGSGERLDTCERVAICRKFLVDRDTIRRIALETDTSEELDELTA